MSQVLSEITSYLKAIGKVSLLKKAEEIELGKQVNSMMKCLEVKEKLSAELITDEQWAEQLGITKTELEQIIKIGKKAQEKMVKANLRLVVVIAKKYQNQGLELLDLIQEGNLGLIQAVERFETTKGVKFSTFASHWIKQGITRAIGNKSRLIRLPINQIETLRKIQKKQVEFRVEKGKLPTVHELAESLDLPESKIRWLLQMKSKILSLEQPAKKDTELTLGSLIADPQADLIDFLENLGNRSLVAKLLSELKPIEQKVIAKYYLQTPSKSLGEIGQDIKLSGERVRQIKKEALNKLSNSISTHLNE